MEIADNILKELLKNCYFLNGTAYAGKSTMVRLLAQRHGGIECGENYHDALMEATDPVCQPNLGYFQTMGSWHEFVSRSPEDYGWTAVPGRRPSWRSCSFSGFPRAGKRFLWTPTLPRNG